MGFSAIAEVLSVDDMSRAIPDSRFRNTQSLLLWHIKRETPLVWTDGHQSDLYDARQLDETSVAYSKDHTSPPFARPNIIGPRLIPRLILLHIPGAVRGTDVDMN